MLSLFHHNSTIFRLIMQSSTIWNNPSNLNTNFSSFISHGILPTNIAKRYRYCKYIWTYYSTVTHSDQILHYFSKDSNIAISCAVDL